MSEEKEKLEAVGEENKSLGNIDHPEDGEVKEQQPKFVVFILRPNGEINIDVSTGIDLDEALIIVKKGAIKFERLYENSIRSA